MTIKNQLKFLFFIFFSTQLVAQSDYRITQEFKSRHRSFEIAIEYAKTIEELNKIKKEINEFKKEFNGSRELLNNALYPSNFEGSFATLDKKIEYTNKRLSEISNLQTKVVKVESEFESASDELKKLSSEVYVLRNTNTKLMNELKAFQSGYGGSKESIDSLRNLVNELKTSIAKRDTLIKEIMDNIFSKAEHKIASLNDAERKTIQTQIKSVSLIDNIKNLINDNVEFLNASTFTSEDLASLNNEFEDFSQRWSHFGPKLFDIYSTDEENKENLIEIDSLITDWESSIKLSTWNSINKIFASHNINLDDFNNGLEFENIILSYIENEINNGENTLDLQKDKNYVFFAERVWSDIIKANWIPLLISENLLTAEQVISIEDKLTEWKDSTSGSKSYFIYAIIILLAIIILVSLYIIKKKKKKNNIEPVEVLENEIDDEYEIDDEEKFDNEK